MKVALSNPVYDNVVYNVVAQDLTGYIEPGTQGIEYGMTTLVTPSIGYTLPFHETGIVTDGVVKLLTVTSAPIDR